MLLLDITMFECPMSFKDDLRMKFFLGQESGAPLSFFFFFLFLMGFLECLYSSRGLWLLNRGGFKGFSNCHASSLSPLLSGFGQLQNFDFKFV